MQLAGSSYNKPVEVLEKPLGWEKITGEDGSEYYYNHTTGESSWSDPEVQGGGEEGEEDKRNKDMDLPEGWTTVQDEQYGTYYFHEATGETSWTHPGGKGDDGGDDLADEGPSIRESMSLPSGWKEVTDESYGVYFFNESTGETVYEKPGSEGSESALPAGWSETKDEEGNIYYYHENGETSYEKPGAEGDEWMEPSIRESMTLPNGWKEVTDKNYGIYFFNDTTGETAYERPPPQS